MPYMVTIYNINGEVDEREPADTFDEGVAYVMSRIGKSQYNYVVESGNQDGKSFFLTVRAKAECAWLAEVRDEAFVAPMSGYPESVQEQVTRACDALANEGDGRLLKELFVGKSF